MWHYPHLLLRAVLRACGPAVLTAAAAPVMQQSIEIS